MEATTCTTSADGRCRFRGTINVLIGYFADNPIAKRLGSLVPTVLVLCTSVARWSCKQQQVIHTNCGLRCGRVNSLQMLGQGFVPCPRVLGAVGMSSRPLPSCEVGLQVGSRCRQSMQYATSTGLVEIRTSVWTENRSLSFTAANGQLLASGAVAARDFCRHSSEWSISRSTSNS